MPHEKQFLNIKSVIEESDLVIVEATYPSTGQGIELVWAYEAKIPIICVYKITTKISDSLRIVTDKFTEYENTEDLLRKLAIILIKFKE
ncbi:MAG: hypothetical protein CO028_02535 [Candidatus Levybacteria bacterium CG_4_9_14_0_2_um_filter_35_21]|nr:MAG: hypothetical protein COW87_01385 [Candidatus Levybacteria bacterium CG22_combo_CG10-13_8_21_14_all_35_11]PJC54417.1 MAG: hypothetical protein CO028_02535 [Candidatus Levybacteria bacterium CG_4_9_14_0_2_um_filter_35_21]